MCLLILLQAVVLMVMPWLLLCLVQLLMVMAVGRHQLSSLLPCFWAHWLLAGVQFDDCHVIFKVHWKDDTAVALHDPHVAAAVWLDALLEGLLACPLPLIEEKACFASLEQLDHTQQLVLQSRGIHAICHSDLV